MGAVELVRNLYRDTDDRFALTGATGWFGRVTLDLLYEALGPLAEERVVGYARTPREIEVRDGRRVAVRPLTDLPTATVAPTVLLHLAFLTPDRLAEMRVEDYVTANVEITSLVLEAISVHCPRHVVVAGSGAVYPSSEVASRGLRGSPYGHLKRIDELAFRAATADVGGTCVIPRVFSVAGDRMPEAAPYALRSMIGMALSGGPIVVRARGPVYRSYCGVDEIMAAALAAAVTGRAGSFDSTGTVVEMGTLGEIVASAHGLDLDRVVRDTDVGAPEERYVGDGAAMDEIAARAGLRLRPLPELVQLTSESLAHLRQSP